MSEKATVADALERLAVRRQQEDEALIKGAEFLRKIGSFEQAETDTRARVEAVRREEAEAQDRLAKARQERVDTERVTAGIVQAAKDEAAKIIEKAKSTAKVEAVSIIEKAQAEAQTITQRNADIQAQADAAAKRLEATQTEHAEVSAKLAAAKGAVKQILGEHQ